MVSARIEVNARFYVKARLDSERARHPTRLPERCSFRTVLDRPVSSHCRQPWPAALRTSESPIEASSIAALGHAEIACGAYPA